MQARKSNAIPAPSGLGTSAPKAPLARCPAAGAVPAAAGAASVGHCSSAPGSVPAATARGTVAPGAPLAGRAALAPAALEGTPDFRRAAACPSCSGTAGTLYVHTAFST